ncbi:MAG: hypothetical protein Fur0034_19770 [Desulfuromonadia bacterium]
MPTFPVSDWNVLVRRPPCSVSTALGRLSLAIAGISLLLVTFASTADAFWWGSPAERRSGLDLSNGFDMKTVVTLSGTLLSLPAPRDGGPHTDMTISTDSGEVVVILGPWSYWEKNGVTFGRGERVTVSGSRAVGRDGKEYLFAQWIERGGDGTRITLRDPSGKPAWSRSGIAMPAGQPHGVRGGEGYRYRGGGAQGGKR